MTSQRHPKTAQRGRSRFTQQERYCTTAHPSSHCPSSQRVVGVIRLTTANARLAAQPNPHRTIDNHNAPPYPAEGVSRRTVATGQRRHRRGDCRATVPQSVAAAGGAGAVLLPLPPLELVGLCERTKRVCRRVVPRDHALRHPAVREWQHVHKQWKPSSQELREVRCSGGRHDSATQHSTHTTIKTITMGLSTATVKRRHATADGSRLPRKLIAPNTHGKQPLRGAAGTRGPTRWRSDNEIA